MVLSLQSIFALISKQEADYEFEVTCSYLEVYNEVSPFLRADLEPNNCVIPLEIIQVVILECLYSNAQHVDIRLAGHL
jgi:hypothetical protein